MTETLTRRQRIRQSGAFSSFLGLIFLLDDFRESKYKEPKDMVYSLLVLIKCDLTPRITPLPAEYSIGKEELAMQSIHLSIDAGLNLDGKSLAYLVVHFYTE